jgi:hypothetical protein
VTEPRPRAIPAWLGPAIFYGVLVAAAATAVSLGVEHQSFGWAIAGLFAFAASGFLVVVVLLLVLGNGIAFHEARKVVRERRARRPTRTIRPRGK